MKMRRMKEEGVQSNAANAVYLELEQADSFPSTSFVWTAPSPGENLQK